MSINRKLNPCFQISHSDETKIKISNALINNVIRYDHSNNILPKYVKFINWKDRQGYAIISHPKCKIKYFVSKLLILDELLEKCLMFLESLSSS